MVFGTLHLTVTGLHQSGPYYCYDIRTDASWGTILRVLHDVTHLVFTVAHIISYHEATETQRDWLDSHSQQPSLLYLFLCCQWLLTSSYSLGETQSPSTAADKALHDLAPTQPPGVIISSPFPFHTQVVMNWAQVFKCVIFSVPQDLCTCFLCLQPPLTL